LEGGECGGMKIREPGVRRTVNAGDWGEEVDKKTVRKEGREGKIREAQNKKMEIFATRFRLRA